jgi:hypothetical protein
MREQHRVVFQRRQDGLESVPRAAHATPVKGAILAVGVRGDGSLVDFANTVVIRRSAHDVFEFLADFENVPKWNHAIVQTRKTSQGPVGVGTSYLQVRSLPSRSEEEFEVVEFESDHRLAIRGGLGPFEGTCPTSLSPSMKARVSR